MAALPAGQYRIYSTYSNYGGYGFDAYLEFPGQGTGIRPILEKEASLTRQVWTLDPAGEATAYNIVNRAYKTYITVDTTNGSSDLISGNSQRTWYIKANGLYNVICVDAPCSSSWWASDNDLSLMTYSGPPPANALWGITPQTSSSSTSQATQTSSTTQVAPTGTSTPGNLANLQQCSPCGKTKCSFSPSGDPTTGTYSILFGEAVANCNPGSTQDTTTTVGGTFELSESYSVVTTVGGSLAGPIASLGAIVLGITSSTQYGRETQKTRTQIQETEVSIPPGQIGALVVNMTYTLTPGQMKISSNFFSFTSNAPGQVLGYSVVYTGCGSQFQALTLPMPDCSGGSGFMFHRIPSKKMVNLIMVLLFAVPWLFGAY